MDYDKRYERKFEDALERFNEMLYVIKGLRLLLDWAVQCDFGYDNIPEEYERYKDSIDRLDLGYKDGLIYIATQEAKRMELEGEE